MDENFSHNSLAFNREITVHIFEQINIVYCEKTNTDEKDILVKKDTQVFPKIKLISQNVYFGQIALHP